MREHLNPYFEAFIRTVEPRQPRAFEFILWIGERWGEWRRENGLGEYQSVSEEQREAFGAWLEEKTSPTPNPTGASL